MEAFDDILHLRENVVEPAASVLSQLLTDNKVDSNLLRALVHLRQPAQLHLVLKFVWGKLSPVMKGTVRSELLEWVRESTISVPAAPTPTDRLLFLYTVKGLLDPLPSTHDWCTTAMTIVYNLPEHADVEPFGSVIDFESMRRAFWSLSRGIKTRDHLRVLLEAVQLALAPENQEKHDT